MGSLQNGNPNSQSVPTDVQKEANIYEDEINLIDYFRVLWKRKYFILLGSVLPALIVGLIFFFSPRNYKVTYVYDVKDRGTEAGGQNIDVGGQSAYIDARDRSIYVVRDRSVYGVSDWNLNEKNYLMLLDRFYSAENLNKIVGKLREKGLGDYAKQINSDGLKNFVDFKVWPPYTDIFRAKIIEPSQLEHIRQLSAQLLNMTIVARPKNDISKISSVIRDNLENVIPVYMVEEHLNADTRGFRAQIADIGENRFDLELALKANKSILAKLKNIKTPVSDRSASNIALQFDISGKTEYLPVEYQIQATESKTTQVEGQAAANEKKYNYYKDLLALNERLLAELKNRTSSYYAIQQFHSFLTGLVDGYENKELKEYLNSYIKRVENRISVSAPVTEKPKVYRVSKGTVKKIAIVFAVALMISVFASFLLEGLKKSQHQTS